MKLCHSVCVAAMSVVALSPLQGQQIVHALTGTVSAIDTAHKSITIVHGGTPSTFKIVSSPDTRISFDKSIAHEATAAKKFQKQGAYVILFYYGMDENRTAVALKPLGPGPFSSITGEVRGWDGHHNTLVLAGQDGKKQSFTIGPETVAETYAGVRDGSDIRIQKGDHVRVLTTTKDGKPTVLFVGLT
jgi:hypothetical protein